MEEEVDVRREEDARRHERFIAFNLQVAHRSHIGANERDN